MTVTGDAEQKVRGKTANSRDGGIAPEGDLLRPSCNARRLGPTVRDPAPSCQDFAAELILRKAGRLIQVDLISFAYAKLL
jgi:hypothetical protein